MDQKFIHEVATEEKLLNLFSCKSLKACYVGKLDGRVKQNLLTEYSTKN